MSQESFMKAVFHGVIAEDLIYPYPALAPEGLVQFLSTEYKFAISFAILVIVLLVRPTGIFRGQSV